MVSPTRGELALFRLVRGISLLACVVILMAIAFAITALLKPGRSTAVTYGDILRARADSAAGGVSLSDAAQVRMPTEVSRRLGNSGNAEVLQRWLSDLDIEQKQEFLDGLASVIREAEQRKDTDVVAAINDYKNLKLAKLSGGPFDRYAQQARRASLLGAIVALFGVLGLLATILVLLAIERNTRVGTVENPKTALGA